MLSYRCVYFDKGIQSWTAGGVCSVKNSLMLGFDKHVDCACKHMSLYAVKSDVKNANYIGYPFWFHVSCFITIVSLPNISISYVTSQLQIFLRYRYFVGFHTVR